MKNIFFLLLFVLLYACEGTPAGHTRPPRQLFHTTAPSQLYFKNMRSYHYAQSTKPGTRIDTYTLKKFSTDSKSPVLIPIIENNWMEDEAYILLEKNNYPDWSDTLQLQFETGEEIEFPTISTLNMEAQYAFAKHLYEELKQGHRINVYTPNQRWQPLYESQPERANFLRVLQDYYNLTESSLQ